MSDEGMIIYFDEDGTAKEYDDTYDITIHCKSFKEQNELLNKLNTLESVTRGERWAGG